MDAELKKGRIAICSLGGIGLLTSDGPVPLPEIHPGYSAWTGVYLVDCPETGKVAGDLWCSSNPRLLASSPEGYFRVLIYKENGIIDDEI